MKETMIDIGACANIIEQYILEKKGRVVKVRLPLSPNEYSRFILAFNIACVHYNLTINI